MAEDWAVDVRKYAPDADDAVIAGIVRYCGIALRTRDASLVAFSDPVETARVRDGYCRKKLALTDPDGVIDAAIAQVGTRMGGDPTRNRVTVYYLLAETFGKLGLFTGTAAAAEALLAAAMAPPTAAPAVARPEALAAMPQRDVQGPDGGVMVAGCGALAVIILGAAALATVIGSHTPPMPKAADAILTPMAAAAEPAAPAIPDGAGVTAQEVEGKPMVSVYFDTAKTDIAPDFAAATAPVKAWVDSHPGARIAVSGFNDPTGNAAFNAELSKNRAKAVAAALAAIGVPADVIDLEKPPETTDTGTSAAQARRVDIVVKDAA